MPAQPGARRAPAAIVVVVTALPRAGGSVVALALAEAAADAGLSSGVAELAPPTPAGSQAGLGPACPESVAAFRCAITGTSITVGRRDSGVLLSRAWPDDPRLRAFFGRQLLPPPQSWLDACGALDLLVIDFHYRADEELAIAGNSMCAPWLLYPPAPTRCVLAVGNEMPAWRAAAAVLGALADAAVPDPLIAIPKQSRVPKLMREMSLPALSRALADRQAVPVPSDSTLLIAGPGRGRLPEPVMQAAARLLDQTGLASDPG